MATPVNERGNGQSQSGSEQGVHGSRVVNLAELARDCSWTGVIWRNSGIGVANKLAVAFGTFEGEDRIVVVKPRSIPLMPEMQATYHPQAVGPEDRYHVGKLSIDGSEHASRPEELHEGEVLSRPGRKTHIGTCLLTQGGIVKDPSGKEGIVVQLQWLSTMGDRVSTFPYHPNDPGERVRFFNNRLQADARFSAISSRKLPGQKRT
jgi:hypothetical protein